MAQITVNARSYELVTVPDLTLDEAIVLWDYTKLGMDQISEIEGFHPGLIKALIHISVARGEPDESARTISRTVGQIKWAELNTVFEEISEDVDEVPPPTPASSSSGSGAGSSSTGEPPPEPAAPNGSGSPGSATGPIFDRVTSPI